MMEFDDEVIVNNDEEDDEMADLFSFGVSELGAVTDEEPAKAGVDNHNSISSSRDSDLFGKDNEFFNGMSNGSASAAAAIDVDADSFFDMVFDSAVTTTTTTTSSNDNTNMFDSILDDMVGIDGDVKKKNSIGPNHDGKGLKETATKAASIGDKETLAILNWLDEGPDDASPSHKTTDADNDNDETKDSKDALHADFQIDDIALPPPLPENPIEPQSSQLTQQHADEKQRDQATTASNNDTIETAKAQQHDHEQQQQATIDVTATKSEEEDESKSSMFNTLREALESTESTKEQICHLFSKENHHVEDSLRPELWCRVVVGKTIQETLESSLADSFQQWLLHNNSGKLDKWNEKEQQSKAKDQIEGGKQEEENGPEGKSIQGRQQSSSKTQREGSLLDQWIIKNANVLAPRLLNACPDVYTSKEQAQEAISLLLHYHYQNNQKPKISGQNHQQQQLPPELDPLLPPVICTILSSGVSTVVASVLLAHITPTYMPFLALTDEERYETAAKIIHTQFYLLACYHLPLLVYHLDRYVPGWLWPKKRIRQSESSISAETKPDSLRSITSMIPNSPTQKGRKLKEQGAIPQSWLITHLAGECCYYDNESEGEEAEEKESEGDNHDDELSTFMMDPKRLRALWDNILTNNNNSLRFFLALAILEKYSDNLLLLTGDDLLEELNKLLEFGTTTSAKDGDEEGTFLNEPLDDSSSSYVDDYEEMDNEKWVQIWTSRAQALRESTPTSVVNQLRKAEDEAVVKTLQLRQEKVELLLKQRLEAEARAHREAQEQKAEEARMRLTRARLIAFYRKYNPEKECNIDKIMETYIGRYEELDFNLKKKYGVGFNPALKPKTFLNNNTSNNTNQNGNNMNATNKLLSSMNKSFVNFGKQTTAASEGNKPKEIVKEERRELHKFAVSVEASEVLPIVCWSKEAVAKRSGESCISADTAETARKMLNEKGTSKNENDNGNSNKNKNRPLKFYIVDSRTEGVAYEQGRFPISSSLSPESLLDPERLETNEEVYEGFRGSAHICVMGEGISAIPKLYGQKLTPRLEELMIEDESRTHNCALFFFKRGFPFVSVLNGGFAAAHAWLVRDGNQPPHNFVASELLVNYNENSSLFGQMEVLYKEQQKYLKGNSKDGAHKNAQAPSKDKGVNRQRLQNLAQRIENLTNELDSQQGREKVGESMSKFFRFGVGGRSGSADQNKQEQAGPSSSPSPSTAANEVPINSNKSDDKRNTSDSTFEKESTKQSSSSAVTSGDTSSSTTTASTGPGAARKTIFGVVSGWPNLQQETLATTAAMNNSTGSAVNSATNAASNTSNATATGTGTGNTTNQSLLSFGKWRNVTTSGVNNVDDPASKQNQSDDNSNDNSSNNEQQAAKVPQNRFAGWGGLMRGAGTGAKVGVDNSDGDNDDSNSTANSTNQHHNVDSKEKPSDHGSNDKSSNKEQQPANVPQNRFAGWGGLMRGAGTGAKVGVDNSDGENHDSTTSTSGAQQQQQQQQQTMKINPFARFGGGGVNSNGHGPGSKLNSSGHGWGFRAGVKKMNNSSHGFRRSSGGGDSSAENGDNSKINNNSNHGFAAGLGKFGQRTLDRVKSGGSAAGLGVGNVLAGTSLLDSDHYELEPEDVTTGEDEIDRKNINLNINLSTGSEEEEEEEADMAQFVNA